MDFGQIIKAIDEGAWISDTRANAAAGTPHLTDTESKLLHIKYIAAFENRQLTDCANALVAALVTDPRRVLQRLRRSGVLRPSKNGFDSDFTRAVLELILRGDVASNLSDDQLRYMQSVTSIREWFD